MESDTERISNIVVGKKRSGKTYYVVEKMLAALMAGDVVVSNIQLKWDFCQRYFRKHGATVPADNYRFLDTQAIIDNPQCILDALSTHTTLALDEFHLIFDARAFAETAKKAGGFQTFLTQAGKVYVTTYFITQEASLMDSRLAKQATRIFDISNWLQMPILGPALPLPVSLVRCKDHKGNLLYREWWWRPSDIGRCYDTHQRFLGIELGGAPARPVIGRRSRRLAYGLRVAAVGLFCVAGSRFYNRNKSSAPSSNSAAPPAPSAAPVADQAPLAPEFQPVTYEQLVSFESSLPRLHSVHRHAIVLDNGLRLQRGSPLGMGSIVRWGTPGAGVLNVLTDAPEMPIVRLYEYTPLRYLPTSNPLRSDVGGSDSDVSSVPVAVPELGARVVVPTGAASSPAASFNPPQPFIPQMSPVRQLWFTSDRVGSATPIHGFSDSPYK